MVGATVVGAIVVGTTVVGAKVVGATVVPTAVVGAVVVAITYSYLTLTPTLIRVTDPPSTCV